ncbi:MAG: hypothetical protein MJE77_12410 [Proteobacteria bacterium]|nr:hypothetical protein [Pseudomonadota bacterium]
MRSVYTARVTDSADRYNRLVEEIRREFPGFRVVRKDRSRFQQLLHYGLCLITLGRMRRYLDGYQTTIGRTVYVTPDWDCRDADDRYVTLRHERVHLRQFRRYTLIGMSFAYLLLPLPLGLAYCRARLEWEAYEETMRAAASLFGIEHVRGPAFRNRIIEQFTGPSYGWMWPFRRHVDAWYDSVLAALTPADGESA